MSFFTIKCVLWSGGYSKFGLMQGTAARGHRKRTLRSCPLELISAHCPLCLGMDALVTLCCRNTNVIMVWAWMRWSPYALETRTLLWFGHGCTGNRLLETRTLLWFEHGCTGNRMLSKHDRYYGLGMDALVTVCSRNTNAIMVWAWMLW